MRKAGNALRSKFCEHAARIALIVTLGSANAAAQDMEPRAYSRAPVGTQTVVVTYGFQHGDILTDSALPLTDVSVKLNTGVLGYARTFGIYKKQVNFGVAVPYFHGWVKGTVFEEQLEVKRSGLGDMRLRFSTMLRGAPALSPKEFAAHKPKTLIGVTLSVIVPTGQYDPRRLVNIGSNRWAFKPEVGISKPFGKWNVEFAGGGWFFTENSNFFGGVRRRQEPLLSLQAHTSYMIKPRMWVAFSGTYFRGGRTKINGVANNDAQSNSRIGATFAYPFKKRQSLKFAWMKGVTTRFGGDISSYSVGWQYTWF